jgi:hypothetical protein
MDKHRWKARVPSVELMLRLRRVMKGYCYALVDPPGELRILSGAVSLCCMFDEMAPLLWPEKVRPVRVENQGASGGG